MQLENDVCDLLGGHRLAVLRGGLEFPPPHDHHAGGIVEAKAHASEMKPDGKLLSAKSNFENHSRIDACCREASEALNAIIPSWTLSANSHYQLCNRFAWAWKLASCGVPVVLVYLGFLEAGEMRKGGLLETPEQWGQLVRAYARGIVPDRIWDEPIQVAGTPIHALARSVEVNLARNAQS